MLPLFEFVKNRAGHYMLGNRLMGPHQYPFEMILIEIRR